MTQSQDTPRAPTETITLKDLATRIAEASGVPLDSVPVGYVFAWFGPGGVMVFKAGEAFPLREGTMTFALFQGEQDVRVYVVATQTGDVPFRRYTFHKAHPAYFVDLMTLEAFVDAVADEWTVVYEGSRLGVEETIGAIADFVRALEPAPGASLDPGALADAIESRAWEDDATDGPPVALNGVTEPAPPLAGDKPS
jgi:hypothetical protein